MDLKVQSTMTSSRVNKQVFQLKTSRKDGLILQVHHTIPSAKGVIHRVRFIFASLDERGELLAAVDHQGNIFTIDLANTHYWMLPNLGVCTTVAFCPSKRNIILVGTQNCLLNLINVELGRMVGSLEGHATPAFQVSFSSCGSFCLSVSEREAIVWDLRSNSLAHRLSLKTEIAIKHVTFMPVSNNILGCFQDDSMHVWEFGTFECLKQIIPDAWKHYTIKSIAFTRNGRAMVVSGNSDSLVVFCLDTWQILKIIDLPNGMSGVKHIEFLPQVFDGGANKILGVLSTSCTIHFLDIELSVFFRTFLEPQCSIKKFTCSPNGKYIVGILKSGEINIYKTSSVLKGLPASCVSPRPEVNHGDALAVATHGNKKPSVGVTGKKKSVVGMKKPFLVASEPIQQKLDKLYQEIRETLDLERLMPLLKQFGEYPENYRLLIWKALLKLPGNQGPYASLVNRGCHPAFLRLDEEYPLQNKAILNKLKWLLSCLAHWCPLFAEVRYLPHLIFPFVSVFHKDPFVCFEAVMSILLNWCQFWFQYFPYPPINVLAMVENTLGENDPELLAVYCKQGVTSQLYAWSLLEVAFSEVLSKPEWLQLWDHVLSNEPAFLLMAVVAYNMVHHKTLIACQGIADFEAFFQNQNPVDMKAFLSKTYQLCRTTSDEVHPRQYLKDITPLESRVYPAFNEFPKYIVQSQADQLQALRDQEEEHCRTQAAVLKLQAMQQRRQEEQAIAAVEEERLQNVEKEYRHTVRQEELRTAGVQKRMRALQNNLRARELEFLESTRDQILVKNKQERQRNLAGLIDDIHRKREQEETELNMVETETRRHYAKLLSQKLQLEQTLGISQDPKPTREQSALQGPQQRLAKEVTQMSNVAAAKCHAKQVDVTTRIAVANEMLHRVEAGLEQEMARRHSDLSTGKHNLQTVQMELDTMKLECEVEALLKQLKEMRLEECDLNRGASNITDLSGMVNDLASGPSQCRRARYEDYAQILIPAPSMGVLSADFYKQEQKAVQAAMNLRKQLLVD